MSSSNAGLTTSLRTLVNALQTNQTSLSFVSDNIANVNTTGYTKRIVSQETKVSNGVATGVGIAEIRRSIDEFLLQSVRAQISKAAQSNVTNKYFDRLQKFTFGDPNSPFTINNSLNTLYTRFESFSNDPSSAVSRTLVLNSAQDFANTVSQLASNIQNERLTVDNEIGTTIGTLNNLLSNLFDINKAITQSTAVGGDIQTLYDARDIQLNKLKGIIDADFTFNELGQVRVDISSTELLGFSQKYQLDYNGVSSIGILVNNTGTAPITITSIDSGGQKTANTVTLLSGSNDTRFINNIPQGALSALIDLRDNKLPNILSQLDTFAYTFADSFNEIHNSGTGFPPQQELVGTESFSLNDSNHFSGQTRLTVTDDNGTPVDTKFGYKLPPLLIDFNKFNGGDGTGTASVQSIINEINQYYGVQPTTSVNLGSAKDIRVASAQTSVTAVKASGTIAFSGQPADGEFVMINGTQVTFVTGTPSTNEVKIGANTAGTVGNLREFLNSSSDPNLSEATYTSSNTTLTIKNKLAGTSGNSFSLDDSGTLSATASGLNLAGGTNVSGNYSFGFDFSNLSTDGSDIQFDVTQISVNGGLVSPVAFDSYTQKAGDRKRTDLYGAANNKLAVSLTGLGLEQGDTFDITATVQVTDSSGAIKTEDITFTVTIPDPDVNSINTRSAGSAVSGTADGQLVNGTNTIPFLSASLVNENGDAITDLNTDGFLRIKTSGSAFRISIDQLDSKETGIVNALSSTATNRGFSHFFGLNNFFSLGNSSVNSALNLQIRSDIVGNPSLLSSGKAKKSVSTSAENVYTYEVGSGSNEAILDILKLQDRNLKFAASGSLPELSTTIDSYATNIYNYSASLANDASAELDKDNLLKDTLQKKFDDVSGVNLDEELAQTIEIQNAYAAAAKVLGVVKDLFSKIQEVLS